MIAAGHNAVDRAGIAELHGMTWQQARRHQPWAQPGHPAPITQGRPALWDYDQAAAFANGDPVPELPVVVHKLDLLDRWEAAKEAGADPVAWERDIYRDRVPKPDEDVLGVPFWYRDTVWSHKKGRAAPEHRGGRPAGHVDTVPRGEVRGRVAELLDAAIAAGEPITTAEIARRVGVHYSTALRHVQSIARERARE